MQKLVNTSMGERQEKLFMSWLVHVVGAASVMTTVKLLSNHAEGEQVRGAGRGGGRTGSTGPKADTEEHMLAQGEDHRLGKHRRGP